MNPRTKKLHSIYEETMNRNDDGNATATSRRATRTTNRLPTFSCADAILDWIVFPLLLFVQFGTTMYCQQQLGILKLPWMPMMGIISVFCLSTIEYRKIYRGHPSQSITLLLLPEIFTNIVLASVMIVSPLYISVCILAVLTVVILFATTIGHFQVGRHERSVKDEGYKLLDEEFNEDSDDEWVC